ncbi:MAG: leucyl/phenylalanyl-tRNA--protein transferase, partial [Sinobacterium sp.]|nr:leucyl/phenylalanyl-tRNA--protein transferase [Sinobacterium sp.]
MIPWLNTLNDFPDTHLALDEPNGLLAAGGELDPDWLLKAYRLGIFPWFSEEDPILWWSPSPRCILEPSHVHISKSMRRLINKGTYHCTANKAFSEVISHCANTRKDDGTWILPEMQAAYEELHFLGYAHSVEVWRDDKLVGGIYGVQIGSVFFGESMFSLEDNTSKIAFITLAAALNECGFSTLDCQVGSSHLYTLGAKDISRETFLNRLDLCNSAPKVNPWNLINN